MSNRLLELLKSKEFKFVALAFFLFFLFKHHIFESLKFINENIQGFHNQWLWGIVTIVIIVYSFVNIIKKWKDAYIITDSRIFIYSSFVILYSYIRFSGEWEFLPKEMLGISFTDILVYVPWLEFVAIYFAKNLRVIFKYKYHIIIAILIISIPLLIVFSYFFLIVFILIFIGFIISSLFFKIEKKNEDTSDKSFLYDSPYDGESEDLLGYKKIATDISNQLKKIELGNTFSIGITQKWGNGKTSFLNLVEEQLKEETPKPIIIKYSPWQNNSNKEIVSVYLSLLAKELGKYHSSLNTQLLEYSKKLTSASDSKIAKLINLGINTCSSDKDVNTLYKTINDCMEKFNRKVYVFIDDIDRLIGEEIFECFKIIRNTADFKNIVYISAYDPEYVKAQLFKIMGKHAETYPEKIFQLEFKLPEIENYRIEKYIKEQLEEIGFKDDIKLIEKRKCINQEQVSKEFLNLKEVESYPEINILKKITNYLTNIRDCNRLLNNVIAYKTIVGNEVEHSDLFLVCLLKQVYPKQALELFLNFEDYIGRGLDRFKDKNFSENQAINEEKGIKIFEFKNDFGFNKEMNVSSSEEEKEGKGWNNPQDKERWSNFLELVYAIFMNTRSNYKSVTQSYNYETCYNGLLSEDNISNDDFIKCLESPEAIISKLEILEQNVKNSDNNTEGELEILTKKLSEYNPDDKDFAKTVIYGLFFLDKNNRIYEILERYYKYAVLIIKEIKNNPLGIKLYDIAQIVREILIRRAWGEAKDFRAVLLKDTEIENWKGIALSILVKKIEENIIDDHLRDIYLSCIIRVDNIDLSNEIDIIDPRANKELKDFVTKDENRMTFINLMLYSQVDNKIGRSRECFRDFIGQLFTDKVDDFTGWEKFLDDTIKQNPKDTKLKEIKEIQAKWKSVNKKTTPLWVTSSQKTPLSEMLVAQNKQKEEK